MDIRLTPLRGALIALALGAITTAAVADGTLVPFNARYKVKMSGLSGVMAMSLAKGETAFVATSTIEPKGFFAGLLANGSIEESSTFFVDHSRLVPLRYESTDTIAREHEYATMDFDWQSARATGSDKDGAFEHAIDENSFDRMSIQYALMLDLLNGADSADYTMLDGQRVKNLTIRNLGESKIRVPFGEFTVTQIQHQAENSSRVITLWCARELGYVPVKIEQHRKGKLKVRAVMSGYDDQA